MNITCRKCGRNELIYHGSKTGEKVATYIRLKAEINGLLVLALNSKTLCIRCMREILVWLTDGDAHVRVERKAVPGPKRDTRAVLLQRERIRFAQLRPTLAQHK
jgi:hypothetical protein